MLRVEGRLLSAVDLHPSRARFFRSALQKPDDLPSPKVGGPAPLPDLSPVFFFPNTSFFHPHYHACRVIDPPFAYWGLVLGGFFPLFGFLPSF